MKNKTFYYARVSTREQNLDRQLEAFKKLGAADREIITDKESGKNMERPGYQVLKNAMLRQGDTLVIKSLTVSAAAKKTSETNSNGLRITAYGSKLLTFQQQ